MRAITLTEELPEEPSEGDKWIPEFSSFIIISLFVIATLLVVIVYKYSHH